MTLALFRSPFSAKYDTVYSHAAEEIRASGLYDSQFNYATGRASYSQDELSDPHRPPYAEHGRQSSKSSGLRNELARGETQEYLNELEAGRGGAYGAGGGGGGGKLRKGGRPQSGSYGGEQGYPNQYDDNGYQDGGFRPPQQSSEMHRPRY